MVKYIGLAFAVLMLVGCSPRYQLTKQYVPAQGEGAKVCMAECDFIKQKCQETCSETYNQCVQEAHLRAKDIYQLEQQAYEKDYASYRSAYRNYTYQLERHRHLYKEMERDFFYFNRHCKEKKEAYACGRAREMKTSLHHLKNKRPHVPRQPSRPDYSRILAGEQKACTSNCGCEGEFDGCFTRCGGFIKTTRTCIVNCD